MADSGAGQRADQPEQPDQPDQPSQNLPASVPGAPEESPLAPRNMLPSWNELQGSPSWRIFRIMSEFVEGFTFLAQIQRSVTIFGSARLGESDPYYTLARELGYRLAQLGYTVVTGGGPGVMQAANEGATRAGGDSVGINIQLPHEQRINPYVRRCISLHYFFSRKVMLDFSAEAYIFFPGGFGTLDEFFELVTLAQTRKISDDIPIILVGAAYWRGLEAWMRQMLFEQLGTIAQDDLRIWTLTDDLDQVVSLVRRGIESQMEQRIAQRGSVVKTPDDKLQEATRPMSGSEQ